MFLLVFFTRFEAQMEMDKKKRALINAKSQPLNVDVRPKSREALIPKPKANRPKKKGPIVS